MIMRARKYPFLEGNLPHMGLLNYHPITEVMSKDVITFNPVESVGTLYATLRSNDHNGFPIVSANGHLKGFILRKSLCSLLKYRVFSSTQDISKTGNNVSNSKKEMQLTSTQTVFWDTMERECKFYVVLYYTTVI